MIKTVFKWDKKKYELVYPKNKIKQNVELFACKNTYKVISPQMARSNKKCLLLQNGGMRLFLQPLKQ